MKISNFLLIYIFLGCFEFIFIQTYGAEEADTRKYVYIGG